MNRTNFCGGNGDKSATDHAYAGRVLKLRQELAQHDHAYYVLNSPRITDSTYDVLYQELQALEREYPELLDSTSPTQRIGGLNTGFEKVIHRTKMLSLDNRYTAALLLASFQPGEEVLMEPKIDGLSLKLVYENGALIQAVTRGNGSQGDDVTANAKAIRSIPMLLQQPQSFLDSGVMVPIPRLEVTGEVYMTNSVFEALNRTLEREGDEPFANPRNAASGSLKLKNPQEVAERNLSFVVHGCNTELKGVETMDALLDFLAAAGFQTTDLLPQDDGLTVTCVFKLGDEVALVKRLKSADLLRKRLLLQTDGLVFKVNSLSRQRDLGEGNKYPMWAFAYKFPSERKATTLLGVTLQVGKTGRITPVAELKAVNLSGTVVQRASLCNQDEIQRLDVNIGDTVLVEKSAEIIPKVVGVATKSTEGYFHIPTNCPSCQKPVTRTEGFVDYYCLNPDCHDQVFARLRYAASKQALDLQGVGEGMIRTLMLNAGVRKLSDLFALENYDQHLKPAARKTFKAAREKALTQPFWRQLSALNIEGLGVTHCQSIEDRWPNLNSDDPKLSLLDNWDGVKTVVGESVCAAMKAWFRDDANVTELERLMALGFTFATEKTGPQPLAGKVFVITGALATGQRDEVSEKIRNAGGVVKGSVTKKVHFVVQGVGGGRVKAEAAEKLRVPVITEEQLYTMLGVAMPTENPRGNLEALRGD